MKKMMIATLLALSLTVCQGVQIFAEEENEYRLEIEAVPVTQTVPEEEPEDDFEEVDYYEEEDFSLLDHYGLAADNTDLPAESTGGWDDYPSFWEYNWDNTANATKWGLWGGNGNLQGYVAPSTSDLNARHKMQMYCDGQNIHLRITYASVFDKAGNGDDYNFYIDGVPTKFQVVYDDNGARLTDQREPGTYTLQIRHQNQAGSWDEALGAVGTMTVNEGNLNNVTEITIPVSEFGKQNPEVNTDTFALVEFFTPNLMMSKIGTGGASSGPVPFVVVTGVFFGGYLVVNRKRFAPHQSGCA